MKRPSRLLALGAVVVVAALVAGYATYSAFSSATATSGSSFAAGTVAIGDNDAGGAMLSLNAAVPGDSTTGCIKVTYTGSLPATVRLYGTVTGGLAPYLTLTVTRGTETAPAFPSCSTFSADATNYIGSGPGVVYSGLLSAWPGGYAAGVVDPGRYGKAQAAIPELTAAFSPTRNDRASSDKRLE